MLKGCDKSYFFLLSANWGGKKEYFLCLKKIGKLTSPDTKERFLGGPIVQFKSSLCLPFLTSVLVSVQFSVPRSKGLCTPPLRKAPSLSFLPWLQNLWHPLRTHLEGTRKASRPAGGSSNLFLPWLKVPAGRTLCKEWNQKVPDCRLSCFRLLEKQIPREVQGINYRWSPNQSKVTRVLKFIEPVRGIFWLHYF